MTTAAIDLQILRAFVLAAKEGNVSRTAERLHLTQPAVSLQLKRFAEETGLTLFTRTPHGLALTADGAAMLPQAERVLAAVGDLQQAARKLQGTVRGALRIGTILDPEFTRLGVFLRELVEAAPQIETELRHGMSGSVLAQVLRGDLDVGFHLDPGEDSQATTSAALCVRTLTRFTYRVVAPAGWGPQVLGRDWKALATLPWLATPPESAHHRLLERVFAPLGLSPRRVALVDQEASMLDLLKAGIGLCLVRDSIAIRECQAHGLAMADRVQLDCALRFVSLAARRDEPVIASAWDALGKAWS